MMFTLICVLGASLLINAIGASLFLEPLTLDRIWLVLVLPLVGAICVVYKAIKIEDVSQVPKEAGILAFQILSFMAMTGAVLWLVVYLV